MKDKIWLSSPHLGEKEQEYVQEAFASNWIAPLGPHVNHFEKKLELYNQVSSAVALSSGTAAIHLALDILNIGPGDAVFCQSFTFCGSANPIEYLGATPVFIDSEAHSWNMDPQYLAEAINQVKEGKIRDSKGGYLKPKAIIPVHLYGMPALTEEIMRIAKEEALPVVEDAAESLGAHIDGKKTGTFGDIGIYSFNGNKIITTSGGGALVSSNKDYTKQAFHLATQARDDQPHYEHTKVGYNYRLSNVLAGIGIGQMEVLDQRIAARRANYQRYRDYFFKWQSRGFTIQFQEEREGTFSNRWLTCILVDPEQNRGLTRELIREHLNEKNIDSRPLWKPMHMQPVFADRPYVGAKVCERLFEIGLCLPSGSNLSEADFQRIFEALDELFQLVLEKPVEMG